MVPCTIAGGATRLDYSVNVVPGGATWWPWSALGSPTLLSWFWEAWCRCLLKVFESRAGKSYPDMEGCKGCVPAFPRDVCPDGVLCASLGLAKTQLAETHTLSRAASCLLWNQTGPGTSRNQGQGLVSLDVRTLCW